MKKASQNFANGSSGGFFTGCIGAVDGWLIRIKCPSVNLDNIKNPGTFCSRKGFYAMNVQIIVDKNKKVLCKSELYKGSEHDSPAFQNTKLYKNLKKRIG